MASKASLTACILVLTLAAVAPSAEASIEGSAQAVETNVGTARCAGLVCDAVNLVCETVLHRPCVR